MSFTNNVTQEKSLIFLHIPKAAGITLGMIIARQFPRDAIFAISGADVLKSIDEFKHLPKKRESELDS